MNWKIATVIAFCFSCNIFSVFAVSYDDYQIKYRVKIISDKNVTLSNKCLVTSIPKNYEVAQQESDIQFIDLHVREESAMCSDQRIPLANKTAALVIYTKKCGLIPMIRTSRMSGIKILVVASDSQDRLPYIKDELAKYPLVVLMPTQLLDSIGLDKLRDYRIGIYEVLPSNAMGYILSELILFGTVISSLVLIIVVSIVFNRVHIENLQSIGSVDVRSMKWMLVICPIMMVGTLLLLYYFYNAMVWVLIMFFYFGASFTIMSLAMLFFQKYKWLPNMMYPLNRCGLKNIDFRAMVLFFIGLSVLTVWIINRHNSIGLVLNNIIGVLLCAEIAVAFGITFVASKKFKLLVALLALTLVIDVLMVYIPTPSSKEPSNLQIEAFHGNSTLSRFRRQASRSIMEDVATGRAGSSKEEAPIRFKIPNMRKMAKLSNSRCHNLTQTYSIMGFGDIILPGAFIVYVITYAVIESRSVGLYSVFTVFCYIIGLIITCLVAHFSEKGQPALVFLLPCTIIPTIVLMAVKNDFHTVWNHSWSLTQLESLTDNDGVDMIVATKDCEESKQPI